MAFLAIGTPDILYGNAVHLPGTQVFVEPLVDAVKLVTSFSGAVGEIDLCRPVTVDTPAHAQR